MYNNYIELVKTVMGGKGRALQAVLSHANERLKEVMHNVPNHCDNIMLGFWC